MSLRVFSRPGDRSDHQRIASLLANALDADQLRAAQALAARRLLTRDGEAAPADGCAITLSLLMQGAGFDLPELFWAIDVPAALLARGWIEVPPGGQRAGDIGSTCGESPHHGEDHVYLVVRRVNDDEMVVVDNQAAYPHFRWASAQGGKTPTTMFYRPPPSP
ncbi:hypothetical protein [Mitsuaria sp. GD03876]|uniref:hypothetical protein n=1 Tax=Mitsuaria sp. GD03876 TaxID=2975399 RepID=UPI00244B4073|nr:hypothetical protein [Mitsuaria sp. GD03876]MDH0865675.1 hypothetical protein [Mitsuaria sp. GD03876]